MAKSLRQGQLREKYFKAVFISIACRDIDHHHTFVAQYIELDSFDRDELVVAAHMTERCVGEARATIDRICVRGLAVTH